MSERSLWDPLTLEEVRDVARFFAASWESEAPDRSRAAVHPLDAGGAWRETWIGASGAPTGWRGRALTNLDPTRAENGAACPMPELNLAVPPDAQFALATKLTADFQFHRLPYGTWVKLGTAEDGDDSSYVKFHHSRLGPGPARTQYTMAVFLPTDFVLKGERSHLELPVDVWFRASILAVPQSGLWFFQLRQRDAVAGAPPIFWATGFFKGPQPPPIRNARFQVGYEASAVNGIPDAPRASVDVSLFAFQTLPKAP